MEIIYQWVQNIAFYSILQMLVLHVLPAGDQKKYVQFFMGLVFMILVFSPVLQWTGQEEKVTRSFLRATYDQELEEFLQQQKRLEKNLETYMQEALEEEEWGYGTEQGSKSSTEGGETAGDSKDVRTGEQGDIWVEPVEISIGAEEGVSP